MLKKYIILMLLMSPFAIECADRKEGADQKEGKKKSKMQLISKWQDVVSLAGSIVLYHAENDYFTAGGYKVISDKPSVRAGFVKEYPGVWNQVGAEGVEDGYEIVRLLDGHTEEQSVCALSDSMIQRTEHKCIKMRRPNKKEMPLIRWAIRQKKAKFQDQLLLSPEELTRRLAD
jgi:hypothetical protein